MFLVVDSKGAVETEIDTDSRGAAEAALGRVYGQHTPIFTVEDPDSYEERIENPVAPSPEVAMARSGLPWRPTARRPGVGNQYGVGITMREVLSRYPQTRTGLVDAWQDLLKYFPNKPDENGYGAWATSADAMARHLLKSNAKTEKAIKGASVTVPPSYAVGIGLLPAFVAKHKSEEDPKVAAAEYYAKRGASELPINFQSLPLVADQLANHGGGKRRMVTLCVGSSPECRATCLAFTGQNAAVAYNDYAKLFVTRALFFEPLAFARMLLESIGKHVLACRKKRLEPYVRLNVYSDIPWELFFPELFDYCRATYPDLWLYDYTKISGRGALPKPNYDLTFSYSGTNLDECKKALREKQRVAVVFLRRTAKGSQKPDPVTGAVRYVPAEPVTDITFLGRKTPAGVFEGYPVIDGDDYDMRPKDPRPVVVGLRYKIPLKLEIEQRITLHNGSTLMGKVTGKTADQRVRIRLSDGKTVTLQPTDIASIGENFALVPPSASSKFLVKANPYKGQWIFGVNPSQTNVDLNAQISESLTASAAE